MAQWTSFGVTVIGPGHILARTSNQDAWASKHFVRCDCVVVADGLGSCRNSDIGSQRVCQAVIHVTERLAARLSNFLIDEFLGNVKTLFLESIHPLPPKDCSTTCLIGIRTPDAKIHLAMIGDGMAAVCLKDGTVRFLADDKSGSFSNLVSSLSPKTGISSWRHLVFEESDCTAVLLCTDGISDDLNKPEEFVQQFIETYTQVPCREAVIQIREMLEKWPVPKHSDDKTIACMYRKDPEND